mmetsp:Transcript_54634/g.119651  ORF Transcript_54634/g.119651 Transcript_54634/m.119651 type:complete len:149 (+) Transcript_54634:35-481(+)
MSAVRLEEDDLDEEDRAILKEVSKKGYYHGRPPNQESEPPRRIDASEPLSSSAPRPLASSASASTAKPAGRSQYDDFQKKWDKFDNDEYLEGLERATTGDAAKKKVVPQKAGKQKATSVTACGGFWELFAPIEKAFGLCARRASRSGS